MEFVFSKLSHLQSFPFLAQYNLFHSKGQIQPLPYVVQSLLHKVPHEEACFSFTLFFGETYMVTQVKALEYITGLPWLAMQR